VIDARVHASIVRRDRKFTIATAGTRPNRWGAIRPENSFLANVGEI
jgi:hypothetical protein